MDTEKKRSFIINFSYFVIWAVIAYLLLQYILPMAMPFVLGLIIACIMRKPTKYISQKFHIKYKPVALFMILLFYATVGLLVVLLFLKAISGAQAIIAVIPTIYNDEIVPMLTEAFTSIENILLQIDSSLFDFISGFYTQIIQYLGNMISSISGWAVATASGFATSIPGLIVKLILMIISSFFIAADFDSLFGFLMRQLSEKSAKLFGQIREYVIGTLFVCIRSYIIIMSLTFVELSIGLSVIGIKHSILIAGLIAIFDILPVLGTGGIMLPWALISLLGGDFAQALSLFLVYVIITIIRNIVEPKIVGKQLGLHPVVTLLSMTIGVQLFGVIGLFGFPIGLSLLRHLNDTGAIKILK